MDAIVRLVHNEAGNGRRLSERIFLVHHNSPRLLAVLLLLLMSSATVFAGCGESPDDDDSAGDDDDATGDDDDATGDDDDATGDDDDATGDDDDATGDDDDDATGDDDDSAGVGNAGLEGNITRSVSPVSGQDGIGDLYITIFTGAPKAGPPTIIAALTVAGADLSDEGASIPFQATGLAASPDPYYVEVFLDDDSTGAMGGASEGDLRSDPYSVTIDQEAIYSQDMVLSLQGSPPPPAAP